MNTEIINSTYRTNVSSGRSRRTHVRKRTRVKSTFRFVTFLIIVFGLAVGSFGFATGLNESTASVVQDYTSYTVVEGDTLWDIANEVNQGDTDTRMIVHTICQLNDIQAEELQPGMVLTIPTTQNRR